MRLRIALLKPKINAPNFLYLSLRLVPLLALGVGGYQERLNVFVSRNQSHYSCSRGNGLVSDPKRYRMEVSGTSTVLVFVLLS